MISSVVKRVENVSNRVSSASMLHYVCVTTSKFALIYSDREVMVNSKINGQFLKPAKVDYAGSAFTGSNAVATIF